LGVLSAFHFGDKRTIALGGHRAEVVADPFQRRRHGMVQKPGDSSGTAEAVSTVESSVNFRFSSRELSPYFQAQNEPCRRHERVFDEDVAVPGVGKGRWEIVGVEGEGQSYVFEK